MVATMFSELDGWLQSCLGIRNMKCYEDLIVLQASCSAFVFAVKRVGFRMVGYFL